MSPLPPHDWHAPIVAATVAAYLRVSADHVHRDRRRSRPHPRARRGIPVTIAHGVDATLANLDERHGLKGLPWVKLHEQTSDDFFAAWDPARRADVVFVDGDHEATQVGRDVEHALAILAPDGVVIVHDTLPVKQEWADSNCGDGWLVVESLRRAEGHQVFTVPLFPGLTLISPTPRAIR
jgi:hypothetical protein